MKIQFLVFFGIISIFGAFSHGAINNRCILTSTGSEGTCKLLTECQSVRDSIVKHNRLPQTCGFQGTQPIVCCPKGEMKRRKPGVISKIKCREYSTVYFIENSRFVLPTKTDGCGHRIVKRVVGGEPVSRKEFAHMAALGFESQENGIKWHCGGTIISDKYVLTSATCLYSVISGEVKYVRVGVTNIQDSNHKQEIRVAKYIPHPEYKPPSKYNDIGLIKLEEPIKMNSFARPACLYTQSEITAEEAIATGWGYTSFASGVMSSDLLKVTLPIVDYEFCNMTYKSSVGVTLENGILKDRQLCAGSGASDQKDTCQGDSGGPLQIYHEGDDISCMYDIVGVTSFGKSCGLSPGVYTKVSYYSKWIEDIVWPEVIQ